MSNVTIIRTMTATIQLESRAIRATHDGATLSLFDLTAAEAEMILNQVGRLRLPTTVPQPKPVPKSKTPTAPTAPTQPPADAVPSNLQGSTTAKRDPLPTPDELKAKREEKTRDEQKRKVADAIDQAAEVAKDMAADMIDKGDVEEGEQDRAPLPDADEAIDEQQSMQFVEDLQVHKAVDAAKLVDAGKAKVPDALAKASKLKDVVVFFIETWKLNSVDEMIEAALAWQLHIPTLARIGKPTFKERIRLTFEAIRSDDAA